MNKTIMMGRLTRDPEIQHKAETTYARFSLAVDRKYKKEGEPEADFFNCVAFGKTAEFVEKYISKGMKVMTIGRIQNDNYTNGHGEKVYSVSVIIEEVEFAESKKAAEQNVQPAVADSEGFMSIPEGIEDDLPFK